MPGGVPEGGSQEGALRRGVPGEGCRVPSSAERGPRGSSKGFQGGGCRRSRAPHGRSQGRPRGPPGPSWDPWDLSGPSGTSLDP